MKLEFSRQFSEKGQISSFVEIRPVGAKLLHGTDGHDEANRRFSHLCERA
jgi:hypothetical protein